MAESGSCDRYEFDAPSHVVDFVDLEDAGGEDVWFGKSLIQSSNLVIPSASQYCCHCLCVGKLYVSPL